MIDRNESIGWASAMALLIVAVAGALVAVRDVIDNTNVALILVIFVVAAASVGGRLAGVTAAIVAALSFNFFHTQPYLTLRIRDQDDIITVVLLLVVGLVVGELALWRRRSRGEAIVQAAGAHRLETVVAALAEGASIDETWRNVQQALVGELGAREARFAPGAGAADLPLLTRSGRVVPSLSRWTGDGFELPEVLCIPVVSGSSVLGHVEVEGARGRGVSLDERRVAIALADAFAVALEHSPDQSGRLT
jgi:K+-sensing histidine kinase KdpD